MSLYSEGQEPGSEPCFPIKLDKRKEARAMKPGLEGPGEASGSQPHER